MLCRDKPFMREFTAEVRRRSERCLNTEIRATGMMKAVLRVDLD